MDLSRRDPRKEVMDVERRPAEEIAGSMRFLRAINKWLGGWRATLIHLEDVKPKRVLDIAAGGGDTAQEVARCFDAFVVAVDISPEVLAFARAEVRDPRVVFVRGDALRLPFRSNAFDAAISSLFLHHLTDDQAVELLKAMDRVARAIVVNDLVRRRRLLAWTCFFTALSSNPLVKVDGPLSVLRAFTPGEAEAIRDRAGLPHLRVSIHFGHRMALAGARP